MWALLILVSSIFLRLPQGRNIGISAIIALSATRFLVLERDNRGFGAENSPPPATSGVPGSKRVYLIDISGATDVSGISLNGVNTLPANVQPVSKSLFIDIQVSSRFSKSNRCHQTVDLSIH